MLSLGGVLSLVNLALHHQGKYLEIIDAEF